MAKEQLRAEYQRLSNELHPDKTKTNTNSEMAELNREYEALQGYLEFQMGFDDFYSGKFEDALKQAQGESSGQMSGFAGVVGQVIQNAEKPLESIAKITSNFRDMFSMASAKPKKRVTKKTRTQK